MLDKAQIITSAVSGAEGLSKDNISQTIGVLGDMNLTKVLITDGEGKLLYDSVPELEQQNMQRLIADALQGQDVFYCRYESALLESSAAMPMMLYDLPIGCVYIYESDAEQGAIIYALETTVLRICIAAEVLLVLFSIGFAMTSSRKMRKILDSVQKARAGDYESKVKIYGSDEYAVLAKDFNKLTDRLQASEQAQRRFVSDASHELKTPLASIKLLSDSVIQNEMDAQTMREYVSDIGNEADRLTRLTQKLLAISKAERQQNEYEVVDLAQVVSKAFKMLVSMADLRAIRLTCNVEGACTVLTVEDDMYQIIFNLVENAIKYNCDEGLVHVDLQQQEEDVILTVDDTGVGIPEEALPHIFERFYRVDKARSREQGGSGLGLSIVNELVERNMGQIEVSHREVGGTRFVVTFPSFEIYEENVDEHTDTEE